MTRGYLNRPDLTAEKFVPNPFSDDPNRAGERLYRTGDLACRIPGDENLITFLGRIDHQVKIRGFRIELDEIRAQILAFPGVNEAVVLLRGDTPNEQRLVAYLVSDKNKDTGPLKHFLAEKLPAYMTPADFVFLEQFPMTPGGKVDRRALPVPVRSGERESVPPRDDLEKSLARVWLGVLDILEVGVFDNFFEVGGHSLLALRLLTALRETSGRDLSLSFLIKAPTIAEQAELLRGWMGGQKATPLVQMRTETGEQPFFCVHPVAGDVLCYAKLAQHPELDRPFYGLQSPGLEGADQPDSIEAMASAYIEAMRQVQKQGPFHLGGWSLGGVIAYEMAQQLQAAGEEVVFLALIDSYTPEVVKRMESDFLIKHGLERYNRESLLIIRFALDLFGGEAEQIPIKGDLSKLTPEDLFSRIVKHASHIGLFPASDAGEQARKRYKVFKSNSRAMDNYRPGAYQGNRVVLFRAQNGSTLEIEKDPTGGWARLTNGNLRVQTIPAEHHTLLQEPQVGVLAETLRAGFPPKNHG